MLNLRRLSDTHTYNLVFKLVFTIYKLAATLLHRHLYMSAIERTYVSMPKIKYAFNLNQNYE